MNGLSNLDQTYGHIRYPTLMTWLDHGGHWSKVKVTTGLSMWWRRHPRRRLNVEVHVLVVKLMCTDVDLLYKCKERGQSRNDAVSGRAPI